MIQYLKAAFPNGYFYFVVHYQNWAFSLNGDVVHLKQVLHNKDVSTLSISDQGVYRSFLDERKLYQTVDRVICLSQFTLSLIKELYDVSDDKINLIYNGLKDKNHLFTENGREILKAQYYFSASEKIILFVGRLNPIKGIDLIIRAFQVVLNQYPNCRLVVIGDGDFSFCFNACGANWSKITFTGRLNEEQVYDFYRIADVGVMPSMHEQCSYVAIEMMMFGLPMIVSTTTGLREMVNDKESGYIFDFLSCEMPEKELANLILKILTTPFHDQQKMRHMSRILYEERYSIEKMQNAYLRLI